MAHRELYIDGHFYGSLCDHEIGKHAVVSAYTGKNIGSVAEAGWGEVKAAVEAAETAFKTWQFSSVRERIQLLRSISKTVRDYRQELGETMCQEVGKPITMALAEVDRMALSFDLAADLLTQPIGEVLPASYDARGDKVRITVERFPVGPVFGIAPYNWPYNLAAQKIAPAIAAGCTITLKGSPMAALSTLFLGRIMHEAGVPAGVVNVIHCEAVLAEKAIKHPAVEMVSFTGSPGVGWHIKSVVNQKKVLLELGGDASAIVMPSADLPKMADACAKSAFGYAGQVCISLQHVWLHEEVYDEGLQELVKATQSLGFGDPMDDKTWCGPLINTDAADRVMSWIEEAEKGGAEVVTGGSRMGNVIEPTLIINAPSDSKLCKEEVFGPVMVVHKISSLNEAFERINGSKYGIHAAIFTESMREADLAYRSLKVGGVIMNAAPNLRFDNMPYGGEKLSGVGREGIASAYKEMTYEKVNLVNLG